MAAAMVTAMATATVGDGNGDGYGNCNGNGDGHSDGDSGTLFCIYANFYENSTLDQIPALSKVSEHH